MTRMHKRAAAGAAAALALGGLTGLSTGAAHAAPDDVVQVQILGINDFHGRILPNSAEGGAAVIAGAVKQLEEANPNTVFAAAGDLIGASTFESFINKDKPTIDALNAAGLDVSAVGNHEFDQGYDDLVNRVMAPYDATTNPYGGAEWEYIGANVRKTSDGTQADGIEASWMQTFTDGDNSVEVGFVGAVTEHLDELVSPGGIAGIEAADIVASVNDEAANLKAVGAELVVLLVHEGAATTKLEDATDPTSDFGKIVNGVSNDIGAIVSGHTHLAYNHTIDGMPVVSAGQYGVNLNQLVFDIDSATGEVAVVSQEILPLVSKTVVDAKDVWTPNYPVDADVKAIVDAAKADADVKGAEPIGTLDGSFNRAKRSDGTSENRGGESTLGNLVAEVQRAQTPDNVGGPSDIAFMNPGGLRADMVGGPDGTLTYKQAAVVQPFANTLVRMELTGAQIKSVLEEQWQPDGSSRPFLRLGISEGFSYTYDPTAARGMHILDMWLNGTEIDPAQTYAVTVNSFLATGGDNFGTLAQGANPQDTGVTDLQAMVDYMAAQGGAVTPDYTQRSVGIDQAPSVAPGGEAEVQLSSLAFSAADKVDQQVVVSIGGVEVASPAVDATVSEQPDDETGTSSFSVPVPADAEPGDTIDFRVHGNVSGTDVLGTVHVGAPTETTLAVSKAKPVVGEDDVVLTATVTAEGATPSGDVVFLVDGQEAGTQALANGTATLTLPAYPTTGSHTVSAHFVGTAAFVPSMGTEASFSVVKVKPTVAAKVKPKKVKADRSKTKVVVKVEAEVMATGKVTVKAHGKTYKGTLKNGKVTIKTGTFPKVGKQKVVVRYLGDANVKSAKKVIKVKVRR